MYKIKTFNRISEKGLNCFPSSIYDISDNSPEFQAILLRSHKLGTDEIPDSVLCVARAGSGVNNIPTPFCTSKGIVVFNTPGANSNAVKELVLAGLLIGSRGILDGIQYSESLTNITDKSEMNRLCEGEKKRFAGHELYGRTLGIVGLGAIGSMVAEMALSLGMNVAGYDPVLSVESAWRLPNQVQKVDDLPGLFSVSDYITLHVPAIDATRHMISESALKTAKEGAVLLNFARDSIVDSNAVLNSLDRFKQSGQGLKQYITDFPEPGLLERNDIVAMPHIGASTAEAEENCAVMAANQIMDYVQNGNIKNSVNFPSISMVRDQGFRLTFSNHNVSGVLGDVLSIFQKNNINVVDMVNKSADKIAYNIVDVEVKPSAPVLASIAEIDQVIRVRSL